MALTAPRRPALRGAAASSPGQVTTTLNAQWAGKWERSDAAGGSAGTGAHDEVSLHLTETCVYNITNWTDTNFGLEVEHCTTNLSASGGGSDIASRVKLVIGSDGKPHGSMQDETTKWSYSAQHPTSQVGRLDLDVATKTGSITLNCCSEALIGSTVDGQAGTTDGGWAARMAFASTAPDVQKPCGGTSLSDALKFQFDPGNSSFDGSNHASYSFGQQGKGGMSASGSFTKNYTVTGGSPKAETEVELVPPKQHVQWMPQADENEKTIGNFIDVEIVAHKKDDPTLPSPKRVLKHNITTGAIRADPAPPCMDVAGSILATIYDALRWQEVPIELCAAKLEMSTWDSGFNAHSLCSPGRARLAGRLRPKPENPHAFEATHRADLDIEDCHATMGPICFSLFSCFGAVQFVQLHQGKPLFELFEFR